MHASTSLSASGLYLSNGSFMRFVETASAAGSLSEEIAVRSRSIDYYAVGNMYLPNPDPVLKAQGKDIRVYTDLLIDDRVGGGFINRAGAAKSLVCSIERGTSSARQMKAVQELFDRLKINRCIETILAARAFGYAPIEVIWGKRDGLTVPVDLVGKPQAWFVFDQENNLRFRSRDHLMDGEELPARKFLCPTNEASYQNPYGLGLLSRCFWPVIFKKGGWRFWIQFSEKYGQVWPVGKLPRSAGKEQQDEMLDVLARMIQDGVAVIPDDGAVEFMEAGSKSATSELYRDIIAEANNAISTVWLGHAGAGESTPGKLGGETAATDVRDDIRDDDANLVTETLQQVVDWFCELNWGSSADAPQVELKEKDQIDTTQAERDDLLSQAMERSGKRLTTAYFVKTYGLDDEDVEDVEEVKGDKTVKGERTVNSEKSFSSPLTIHSSLPLFADSDNDPEPEAQTALYEAMVKAGEPLASPLLDAAERLLGKVESLEEFQDRLIDLYAESNPEQLATVIAQINMLANMAGRTSAALSDRTVSGVEP